MTGREPGQPQTGDDIRICLQPKHRELEVECGRLRERLADTETEKIERGTEILRLREQLDALAEAVEQNAAEKAYAADFGASEWEAFVPKKLYEALQAARAALGVGQ